MFVRVRLSVFKHRATIQWSSLINAAARTALSPNHNSTSTHVHTTRIYAKWTTIFYVIDSKQSYAQDNIHDFHQA